MAAGSAADVSWFLRDLHVILGRLCNGCRRKRHQDRDAGDRLISSRAIAAHNGWVAKASGEEHQRQGAGQSYLCCKRVGIEKAGAHAVCVLVGLFSEGRGCHHCCERCPYGR
jgi:hypothetical protein